MSSFQWLKLSIHSNSFRENSRGRYDATTFAPFIDKYYEEYGWEISEKNYEEYLDCLETIGQTNQ